MPFKVSIQFLLTPRNLQEEGGGAAVSLEPKEAIGFIRVKNNVLRAGRTPARGSPPLLSEEREREREREPIRDRTFSAAPLAAMNRLRVVELG